MFGSQILDVAIGMIFVFLLLSLMCSALNEIIEARLKNRAKSLETGIRNLLGNDKLADDFYDHALISGLFKNNQKPSYIPSRTFALALMNIVAPQTGDDHSHPLGSFREALSQIKSDSPAAPIKQALLALADDAQGDINQLRTNIENWYDDTMDRVSGWYKRRTHTIIIFLGLGLAIALNADSAYIARNLSNDAALRNSLVSAAQAFAQNEKPTDSARQSPATSPANGDATPSQGGNAGAQSNSNANSAKGKSVSSQSNSNAQKSAASASPASSPAAKVNTAARNDAGAASPETSTNTDASAQTRFDEDLKKIRALGLPMGWNLESDDPHLRWPGLRIWQTGVPTAWAAQIRFHWLGWILTALAISLGAPFWFDMLGKFITVRSTMKPEQKSPDVPSKG
jgi:hypothetical protein